MSSWQKISSKLIYQCPYYQVYEDEIITPDGRKSIYYKEISRGAVTIVALDKKRNIYLLEEDKYITDKIITLPAGAIDKGETALDAAKRELKEEVGLQAKKWQDLGSFWTSPGRSNQKGWIFLAQNLTERKQELEKGEVIEIIKVPFKKAIEWIKEDRITDAWAIIPIFKAKLFLDL